MTDIHSTAVVEDGARLGQNVRIGPFAHVGRDVTLAEGVILESHTVVTGITSVGENTRIFPFASVGHQPQDLKYAGESSRLEIGAHCIIREHATLNPGTTGGGMLTRCGDHCLIMVGAHVADDCKLGNNVILVNNATLGGHVEIGDYAIIGGMTAVHQFVRIGAHAMLGGASGVEADVIPFGSVVGNRARLEGINVTGMKRRGYSREEIHALRSAYRELFMAEGGTFAERLETVAARKGEAAPVAEMIAFIRASSNRGLCQPDKTVRD